jgi:hypothetical protein
LAFLTKDRHDRGIMLSTYKKCVLSQYDGSLQMLAGCLRACKPANWNGIVGRAAFWHVAYHTLYYTDLYLSKRVEDFQDRPFHCGNLNYFSTPSWEPATKVDASKPFDKKSLLKFAEMCADKARESVDAETNKSLAGPSGFFWLPFPRMGAHIYNIRHIQHHTGQLTAFLGRMQGKAPGWKRGGDM